MPFPCILQLDPDEEGRWLRQPHRERAGNHTLRKMCYLEEADAGVGGDLNAEETPQMVSMIVTILVAGSLYVAPAGQEVKVQRNRCRCAGRANCRQRTIC